MQRTTQKLYVLVKAYPQPSDKYGVTVCCAGITPEGRFLRLYPIPYRDLKPEQQFNRFDYVEMSLWKSETDTRPESFKVDPDSIKIHKKGNKLPKLEKVKLWLPFVAESFAQLKDDNLEKKQSLGIVRPDEGSISFTYKPIMEQSDEDQSYANQCYKQMSLFNDVPLTHLKADYCFSYKFTSNKIPHEMKIHDWEVQATYYNYKKKYGIDTLLKMKEVYEKTMPSQNIHLIMGTAKARPWQFMIIGVLHTVQDLKTISAQGSLFD